MATLLSDNFDRANSTTVLGSPQVGPAPTIVAGVMGIVSNQAYAPTIPGMAVYALGTADVELTISPGTLSTVNSASIILGYASLTDYYQIQPTTSTTSAVTLYKMNSGGLATLAISNVKAPTASASIVRAHYKDSIIRVYVDDVLVIRQVLDAPMTATSHGFRIAGNINVRADNLLGTDAPTIAEPILNGKRLEQAQTVVATAPVVASSFVYLGRDTKLQDISEGA